MIFSILLESAPRDIELGSILLYLVKSIPLGPFTVLSSTLTSFFCNTLTVAFTFDGEIASVSLVLISSPKESSNLTSYSLVTELLSSSLTSPSITTLSIFLISVSGPEIVTDSLSRRTVP